jgi:hypothetical protein
MVEDLGKILEEWGTLAGWITAIVQLPIWLIGVPFLFYKNRKRKREMDLIQQDKNYWKEECYKMKDLANSWHQTAKEIKTVLKHKAPEAHVDFVESYGGEDKFQDWYKLPDIPIIENKEDDDLRSK